MDIWAGIADVASGRPWQDDTIALVFSTTKGATAICANLLIERGVLDPDLRVAEVWPEFAANGKADIPLRAVLSHRAGLPVVEGDFTLEQALTWDPVVEQLATQAPRWDWHEPAPGYHVRSYGWITGEIVRRVTGRTIGRVLRRGDRGAARARLVDRAAGVRRAARDAAAAAAAGGSRGPRAHGCLHGARHDDRRRADRAVEPLPLRRHVEHAPAARARAAVVERHRVGPRDRAALRRDGRRGRRSSRPRGRHGEAGEPGRVRRHRPRDRLPGAVRARLLARARPSPCVRSPRVRSSGRRRLAGLRRSRRAWASGT